MKQVETTQQTKVEVIPVAVKPADFKALQAEVIAKQALIDSLQADIADAKKTIETVENRVGTLESLNP